MGALNVKSFPNERDATYKTTLPLRNNLGQGRSEWRQNPALQHTY